MTGSTGERRPSRVSQFRTDQEEAEFWDTHDTTDHDNEWQPVEVRFAERIEHGMMVYFDGPTLDRLLAYAEAKGIDPGRLGGTWIADRLEAESLAPTPR